ncbi:MAG: HEPN domain-containing protein [Candidatus Nanohaloarchaea archaeon]|nr:HEPN domain-containing protein [Candidatus Nanohaloarchaea archaeon]
MNREQQALLETAEERLTSARLLLDNDRYEDAVSRAYYAMFHAAKALLLDRDSDPRTHAGTASELGKLFRDELGAEATREFSRIQEKREQADYGELPDIGPDETTDIVETAASFLDDARSILGDK